MIPVLISGILGVILSRGVKRNMENWISVLEMIFTSTPSANEIRI